MSWQDQLTEAVGRIRAAWAQGETTPETFTAIMASRWDDARRPRRQAIIPVTLPPDVTPASLMLMTGLVNPGEFCGAEPHTLLMGGGEMGAEKAVAAFVLSDRPWNMVLRPDGTWGQIRDSRGQLLYPEADFRLLVPMGSPG